jgi:hypothetical protein
MKTLPMPVVGGAIFVLAFLGHLTLEFLSWAGADSPGGGQGLWAMLSFPVFLIAPSFSNDHFWVLMIANSVVWACALAILGTGVFVLFKAIRR